jgi:hypothetical protein
MFSCLSRHGRGGRELDDVVVSRLLAGGSRDDAVEVGGPVRDPDPGPARQQLARFLEGTFGAEDDSAAAPLQRHVRERLRDDCTYLVVADEF